MKVDEFEYPGLTIHSNRRGECRLERGARVICNRRTAVRSKGKIYRKVVRPAMMHLLDPLKKRVSELRVLRFSVGVSGVDGIRNERKCAEDSLMRQLVPWL